MKKREVVLVINTGSNEEGALADLNADWILTSRQRKIESAEWDKLSKEALKPKGKPEAEK